MCNSAIEAPHLRVHPSPPLPQTHRPRAFSPLSKGASTLLRMLQQRTRFSLAVKTRTSRDLFPYCFCCCLLACCVLTEIPNKKHPCVVRQNVERIIALGPPSATGLEELYKTGKLSRHEVQTRTIAERRRQAEKVRNKATVPYWTRENSPPVVAYWPAWKIHDLVYLLRVCWAWCLVSPCLLPGSESGFVFWAHVDP